MSVDHRDAQDSPESPLTYMEDVILRDYSLRYLHAIGHTRLCFLHTLEAVADVVAQHGSESSDSQRSWRDDCYARTRVRKFLDS